MPGIYAANKEKLHPNFCAAAAFPHNKKFGDHRDNARMQLRRDGSVGSEALDTGLQCGLRNDVIDTANTAANLPDQIRVPGYLLLGTGNYGIDYLPTRGSGKRGSHVSVSHLRMATQ